MMGALIPAGCRETPSVAGHTIGVGASPTFMAEELRVAKSDFMWCIRTAGDAVSEANWEAARWWSLRAAQAAARAASIPQSVKRSWPPRKLGGF